MTSKAGKQQPEKPNLHPRSLHRGRYDFRTLIKDSYELKKFVFVNPYGDESIDFSDPNAVKALNKALLKHFYGITYWDIPSGYLCPPIPGRADYIHYVADLLGDSLDGNFPVGKAVNVLDIGTGANLIYPIIGHREYGWRFVGADLDDTALISAQKIIDNNPALDNAVTCRKQTSQQNIFKGIIQPGDLFDLTLCNPPFHASASEAQAGTRRKLSNLGLMKGKETVLNFGGQNTELWCPGGEEAFLKRMIAESALFASQCFWFSSLISKKTTLPGVYAALKKAGAIDVRTVEMSQGQKVSRFVAWTFWDKERREKWKKGF